MTASALACPLPAQRPEPMPLVRLHQVSKRFGARVALERFALTLRAGEVTALLGPNGAGKSTAMRVLLGLTRADAGEVRVLGRDPRASAVRTALGAMLQLARAPDTLSVREHLELFRSHYPRPLQISEVLRRTGLTQLQHRRFGSLSAGEKQLALFALAICGDPQVVCLDEPTVGLDIQTRQQVWREIRALAAAGKAVLLTTHYLEEADALAQRIVLIERGHVAHEGTAREIKQRLPAHRIRCRTRLDASALWALPTVTAVEADHGAVALLAHDPQQVLRHLLALDQTLSDLEVSAASLQDAYLALTRGA
ncbi:MAG: ABC transporter ATP-binding protein [Steroidobacteraceae bacterium]